MNKQKVAIIHAHTINSPKDAIGKTQDYTLKINSLNTDSDKYDIVALNISEHGNVHSMCSARRTIEDAGLSHILGCELYCCEEDEKTNYKTRYHLLCIPANGYYSDFIKLITDSNHNKYEKSKSFPITTHEILKKYAKGMILSSACIGGRIGQLILDDRYEQAKEYATYLDAIAYKFYLEVQPHDAKEQLIVNEALVKMSKETGIPLLMTMDIHYSNKSEHDLYKAFQKMAMFQSKTEDEQEETTFYSHIRSFEEMESYCIKYNIPISAIENTYEVYNMSKDIDYKPKTPMSNMPKFPVPNGYTDHDYLVEIVYKALGEKIKAKTLTDSHIRLKRINEELRVIEQSGFSGYFLILWDWIRAMKERKILVGPGRGCFLPNNKVLTKDGKKYIKDIKIGDEILNINGDFGKCLDVFSYKVAEEIVKIESYAYSKAITCTKDHKILVNGKYKEAKDIVKGDFLCIPKRKSVPDSGFNESRELGILIGIFLSGLNRDGNVEITSDNTFTFEAFEILYKKCFDKTITINKETKGRRKTRIPLRHLTKNRFQRIIEESFNNPCKDFELGVIEGLFYSSLHDKIRHKSIYVIVNSNKNISYIDKVLTRHNIVYSKNKFNATGTRVTLAATSREKINDFIGITDAKVDTNNATIKEDDNFIYFKVKSNTSMHYNGNVFDLNMENEHSYNVDSFVVHNSAAGSIVNYLLDITKIDPLEFKLLFSRFLNDERVDMPDVDTDLITKYRKESIEYFKEKYGNNSVSQIITYSRYGIKSIIQTAVKMSGGSAGEATALSKGFGNESYDYLKKVYYHPEEEQDISTTTINKLHKNYEKLLDIMEKSPDLKPLIERGTGLISGSGTHAAGVIISGPDMYGTFPTEKSKSDAVVLDVLSVDMDSVSYFGLLKLDDLGLKSLQIIDDCMNFIVDFDKSWYYSEDFYDKNVFKFMASDLGTKDIFQMASFIPTMLIKNMKVKNIEELAMASSINRPGGLAKISGLNDKSMMDIVLDYCQTGFARSLGLEEVDALVKENKGAVLYQEQLQFIGQMVAGYTLGQADLRIRKTIGNFLPR